MALNYLLSPNFQVVSTGGKPCTGGYIEVYLAGTRDKYFCASDFSGTLHPFKIPLDALGANIVLADEANAYDVYIFNRYGSLLMSRYNVHPAAGGTSVISGTNIISSDGSITVTNTANGVDLSVTDNEPDVIVCSGHGSVTEDGSFSFLKDKGIGDSLYLVSNELYARPGWYNYEALVEIAWNGPMRNEVETVTVNCSGGMSQMVDLDLSTYRVETLNVSGTYRSHGEKFVCAVAGLPTNATARVLKLSVFRINSIVTASDGTPTEQVQSDWLETNEDEPSYIRNKPEELSTSLDSGTELIVGSGISLTPTAEGIEISTTSSGETPWTYTEDKAFEVTVTASDAYSSYFERLVPITSQAVLNSGKDFLMIYQCQVEADSINPPNIPDMTPIRVDVLNYPNFSIDEMTGIFTNLGGLTLQKFASHGSVVLGSQMLADGRLFSVFFPQGTLTEGDKFNLIVRAVYIELTGVNQ